ncbi:hypothetical protein [Methylocystis parvus]|uniref:hypothetical protein n=1 Tax=Methylocystis parvus TaxID=134 RepID=UPI003C746150
MRLDLLQKCAIAAVLCSMIVGAHGARAETSTLLHDAVGCPTAEELSAIDGDVLDDPDIALRDPAKALHILVRHYDCEVLDGGQRVVLIQKGPQYSIVAVHPDKDVPARPLFVRSRDIVGRGPKTVHPTKPARPAPAPAPAGGATNLIN